MADLIIAERSDIVNIANAVRSKTGTTSEMTLGEIAGAVNSISNGGSGVETCTITLDFSGCSVYIIDYCHTDENGKITTTYTDFGAPKRNTAIRLENVVCGSLLYVDWAAITKAVNYGGALKWIEDTYSHWRVAATDGSTHTVYFIDDD